MNYQQFVALLCEKANHLLDTKTTVQIHHALKNNGAHRTGLTISQEHTNISPTIYLEEYYKQYQAGRDLNDIAHGIVNLYHEVKFEHSWEVSQIQNFELAKPQIAYRVIHFQKNEILLKDIPHVPYLDLAIVFYLLLETTEKGAATILITNEMLDYWKISLEHLYSIALENTPRILYPECKPMHVVIQELLREPLKENIEESCMFVLSNHYRHYGAACMLYEQVLEDIGNQLNEDYYILPSSIHEIIILPSSCYLTHEELDDMITEINDTQISEEDVLSEHAYYYSRKERKLLIAKP